MSTDIHALAGAYVLDAVDDVERAAFGRHLAQCETCAAEVDELRETVSRLADDTWSVPPPRLRARVLEQVARTRQEPPGGSRPERDPVAAVSRWRRVTAVAAVAGILAAGAGAATYAVQEQRVRDQRAVAEAARQETAHLQAIMSAPDVVVRTAVLRAGGRVTVAVSPRRDEGVVLLAAAGSPGPDRAFQLWLIDASGATSADVLPVGQSAGTRFVSGVHGKTAFGVSVEPAGGSAAPTMTTATVFPLT